VQIAEGDGKAHRDQGVDASQHDAGRQRVKAEVEQKHHAVTR
jgi:hypothetical protein